MGELLRAVLDASCIDSNPAFYGARLELTLPVGAAANTFADRSANIECKTDTWFLCTGYQQSSALSFAIAAAGPFAGNPTWAANSGAAPIQLRDLRSSRLFQLGQTQKVNANQSLNSFVTLPEYILFEPSSVIEVTQNVQVTNSSGVLIFYTESLVTLAGIEYKLPDRPGGWMNGRGKAA